MRARAWSTTTAVAVLTMGTLSGCTPKDGRTYPTASDVSRAQHVWADPWLATAGATVAGPDGSGPNVERSVAGRAYQTQVAPSPIVTTEVRGAISVGWRLVGAQCERGEKGNVIAASAQLARGSALDDWSLATVESSTRTGDPSATSTGSPASTYTQVAVSASVPHHLDTSWPNPPAQELASSCLIQDPSTPPPTSGPSSTPLVEPTVERLAGERVDPPTWSDDAEGNLQAAVDALADDPGLRSLGLTVAMPTSREDSEPRDAAKASATGIPAMGGLTESVRSLTMQGWTLTYAACIGPGAPNVAELSRPAASRTAVMRLAEVADVGAGLSEQGNTAPVDADVVVSTPGYSPGAPTAITTPCFMSAGPPTALSHKGVPSLGPTRIFPLQR